jgi:hypothetical protein
MYRQMEKFRYRTVRTGGLGLMILSYWGKGYLAWYQGCMAWTQSYNSDTTIDACCLDSTSSQWAEFLADVDNEDEEEEFDL